MELESIESIERLIPFVPGSRGVITRADYPLIYLTQYTWIGRLKNYLN